MRKTWFLAFVPALAALAAGFLLAQGSPSDEPLLVEDFDSEESLTHWQRITGASSGSGPASEVAWDSGGLRLAGDTRTRVWTALTRDVDVHGAEWIRIQGRIRTEAVDPAQARYLNCDFYVTHAEGLIATRVLTGTNDWTEVRRRLELPTGTERVTVGVFLSMPGRAWFDDVRLEAAEAPAWSETEVGHYRYLTLPGDEIPDEARTYNDESYRLVSEFLGVAGPDPVTYFKYPDLATKEELTGNAGNAHRTGQIIHSIWPSDRHEIVHILADAWGDPPALVAEGLAVHLSGGWQGRPVRDYAAELLENGDWLPLSAIFTSADFRARPDLHTYAIAGALVGWILEAHGHQTLRTLYGRLENGAPREVNESVLEELLGAPLDHVDTELRPWVEARR